MQVEREGREQFPAFAYTSLAFSPASECTSSQRLRLHNLKKKTVFPYTLNPVALGSYAMLMNIRLTKEEAIHKTPERLQPNTLTETRSASALPNLCLWLFQASWR
jgi:hypothetical protein